VLVVTILHAAEVRLFDGNFDRFGFGILGLGSASRRLQNGWVQFYGGWAAIVLGAVAVYFGMGG
jgi:hypothetical protein